MRITRWISLPGLISLAASSLLFCATLVQGGGGVSVQTDQDRYGRADVIAATVRNDSATVISMADQQSFCTVLLLEQKVHDGWEPLYNCPRVRVPRTVALAAGTRLVVSLPGPGWRIGDTLVAATYRVTLFYLAGQGFFEGKAGPGVLVAHSPEFQVR